MTTTKTVTVEFEQPLCIMRFHGKPIGADFLEAMHEMTAVTTDWPVHASLIDLTGATEIIDSETRKQLTKQPRAKSVPLGTAIFGASFALRTIATLTINVMNMTHKYKEGENPTKFFENEEQARAWLKERSESVPAAA